MKKYETILVSQNTINGVWDRVVHFIKKTNDEVLNEKDIYNYLISGQYKLFIIREAESNKFVSAYTVSFFYYPRHKACRVITLGGEKVKEYYVESIKYLENWAKLNECDYVEFFGRKGWKKYFPDYKVEEILFRQSITNKGKHENIQ